MALYQATVIDGFANKIAGISAGTDYNYIVYGHKDDDDNIDDEEGPATITSTVGTAKYTKHLQFVNTPESNLYLWHTSACDSTKTPRLYCEVGGYNIQTDDELTIIFNIEFS